MTHGPGLAGRIAQSFIQSKLTPLAIVAALLFAGPGDGTEFGLGTFQKGSPGIE